MNAAAAAAAAAVPERCTVCKRKVGLLGFQCKCENIYCSTHRYAEVHNCSFDYKAEGAMLLKKKLGDRIAATKVEAIS